MPPSIQHGRSANHIVCPNGHLGFAPIKTGSFQIGCHCEPDLIYADSGSCDVGPVPLGTDISSSPLQWQVDDLETMMLASRRLGVPMIAGENGIQTLVPSREESVRTSHAKPCIAYRRAFTIGVPRSEQDDPRARSSPGRAGSR
jgi:hypothetical protein